MEFEVAKQKKIKGESEGELKVFRDKGVPKAYMWKVAE